MRVAWNLYEPMVNLGNIVAQMPAFAPLISRYREITEIEKERGGEKSLKPPVSEVALRDLSIALGEREVVRGPRLGCGEEGW